MTHYPSMVDFPHDHSPTTCLQEIRHELDYQGKLLSRIVRDIHINHEAGQADDNPAIHGLEMVLSEIRGLRSELNEHKKELSGLRDDVNMLLGKETSKNTGSHEQQT